MRAFHGWVSTQEFSHFLPMAQEKNPQEKKKKDEESKIGARSLCKALKRQLNLHFFTLTR